MGNLQFSMTDKQQKYARDLLLKARSNFESIGERFTLASTLIRVLEEWNRNKGFLKETNQERKGNLALSLIKEDPEEYNYILGLIKSCEKGVGPGSVRDLTHAINRIDRHWRVSTIDNALASNIQVANKAKSLFLGVVIEDE